MSFAIPGGNAAYFVFSLDPSAPKYPHSKVARRVNRDPRHVGIGIGSRKVRA